MGYFTYDPNDPPFSSLTFAYGYGFRVAVACGIVWLGASGGWLLASRGTGGATIAGEVSSP